MDKLQRNYMPMSETAFYILLSLMDVRHGYGIMQHVDELTNGRIRLGAGTLYGSLSRMEKDSLIEVVLEEERRKFYRMTNAGQTLLKLEIGRIGELHQNALKVEGKLNE
jgi:DNA-binding PadR family transcriptional regulator